LTLQAGGNIAQPQGRVVEPGGPVKGDIGEKGRHLCGSRCWSARSACNGACAQYWPPVTGRPAAGPGVTGRLGAITRSDGSTQATSGGHPLYTYVADTGPGQANGNNLNLNGGLWHELTVTR
jgi:predicted lipoprotein with Yx(FWY)xxD motif